MAYTDYLDTVQKMYIGYYQRPADPEGLVYWAAKLDAQGGDQSAIIAAFSTSAESTALYGPIINTTIGDVVDSIYQALFNRAPDAAGKAFYVDGFNAGKFTPGTIVLNVLNGATGEDALAIGNKLDAANLFTGTVDPGLDGRDLTAIYSGPDDAAAARAWLADVTWNPLSVPNQTETTAFVQDSIADPGDPILPPPLVGLDFWLTAGNDTPATNFTGTAGNDLFIADVVQNAAGAQVDSLGTGDRLTGGAGDDVLEAQLTEGVFAGGGNMPVEPRTTGIEVVKVEALFADMDNGGTDVFLNAKHMLAVDNIGSWYSDANLIIQDLTTQDAAGGMRPVSDMTVTMGYTGNNDHMWDESDLAVYFDQDYLNPDLVFTPKAVSYSLMNEDAYDITGAQFPLSGVYIYQLSFYLNGQRYNFVDNADPAKDFLGPYQNTPEGNGTLIQTYPQMLTALQKGLADMVAANPTDLELARMTISLDGTFLSDAPFPGAPERIGTKIVFTVPGEQLNGTAENVLTVDQTFAELNRTLGPLSIENNNRFERASNLLTESFQELLVNVDLEKVGRAGDGGDLVIGSMYKDRGNNWDNTMAGMGIDTFNVTVYGNEAQSSSLASLSSTNNTLREVRVQTDPNYTSASGDYADLTIGNGNTRHNEYALKDVQIFDSTKFLGDVTLSAGLTGEVVSKYMNLGDVQVDPAADNIWFDYTTGIGNDKITMVIDAANLANDFVDTNVGTTTREDFNLNISTDGGDDVVTLSIDGDALEGYLVGVHEVFTVSFAGTNVVDAGLAVPFFDGTTITYAPGDLPAAFAANVAGLSYADWTPVNNLDGTVTFTAVASGAKTNATAAQFLDTYVGGNATDDGITAAVTVNTDGITAGIGVDGNGQSDPYFAHWYENSKLNANLYINTGSGDDIVHKPGSGDVAIDVGAGHDIVYADNSGTYPLTDRMATFVFNVDSSNPHDRSLQDLESGANDTGYRIFNGQLTVTFKGFESTAVNLLNTQGKVSDLQVNQAIKNAINSDSVLSALLVAKDGPANTLVVESLIDGRMYEGDELYADDLSIGLKAPTASSLSASQLVMLNTYYGTVGQTADQLVALMNADIVAFGVKGDYDTQFATFFGGPDYEGVYSNAVSDNFITPGLGNDVIVLGTGFYSNDTVVYKGFDNGTDSIVNFNTEADETPFTETVIEGSVDTPETFTVTFGDLTIVDLNEFTTLTFDGKEIDITNAPVSSSLVPSEDVANAFVNGTEFTPLGYDVFPTAQWDVDWLEATNQVEFTSVALGDFGAVLQPVKEVFTVNFAGTTVVDTGIAVPFFDGTTINYIAGDSSLAFAANVAGINYADWTVVDNLNSTVTFMAKAAGVMADATAAQFLNDYVGGNAADDGITAAVPVIGYIQGANVSGVGFGDITAADFVFTNTTAVNGGVVISDYVEGTNEYAPAELAIAEVFTVDFNDTIATANGTNVAFFDGTTIDYVVGDGEITMAANVAGISYADWTPVDNLDGTVTFTAKAAGVMFDATAAQFLNTYTGGDAVDDGIIAVVTIDQQGVDEILQVGTAEVTETTTIVEASAGLDYLDFTAYDVKAVYVNGTMLDFGLVPNPTGDTGKYITMVESTTNDGAYTISLLDLGATSAASDNVAAKLIGVADFGVEQAFVAANFII